MSTKKNIVKVSPQGKRASKKYNRKPRKPQSSEGIQPFIATDARRESNRVPRAAAPQNQVQSTDKSITVQADLIGPGPGPLPLQSLAMGVVLTSLSRGWTAGLTDEQKDYPYNAYVYLVQSFISAAQGTVSALSVAPTWYWYILDAIGPTTVKFKTGSVDYAWSFPDNYTYVPPPQLISSQLQVILGYTDPSLPSINGFYPVVLGTYNADIAVKAIQSLFTLYSEDGPMLKRIPRKVTPMQMDVSAFTTVYPEFGGSYLSPGSYANTLQSEVFIDNPLLSKFAYYDYNKYRGITHNARGAGTPCYIIPRMIEMLSPNHLKNKVPPIFKFYNFDEFYEVLALTLARAMEITLTNNAQAPVVSCPLSPQMMQIVLRQSLIPRFCNHMAQDLILQWGQIVPTNLFSVGSNGVSITAPSVPLKLPQLLTENIRACDRRLTYLKNNDHQADLIPVLGRPNYNQLGNYVTKDGVPVFTDVPGETPIDLVNFTASTTIGPVFLDGNGAYVAEATRAFNEWITTLGSALSPLATHAEEDGIRVLSTVVNTLHLTVLQQLDQGPQAAAAKKAQLAKRPSQVNLGKRIEFTRRDRIGASPVDPANTWTRQVAPVAFTSVYAPLTPIYKYLKIMILPSVLLEGDHFQNNIDAQQVFQVEPFRINETTVAEQYRPQDAMSLYERHSLMAEQDVRVNLAMPTEFETELDQMTKSGRGGFFTDLAGMVAGDLLHIPGAKQIASTIGQLTGL